MKDIDRLTLEQKIGQLFWLGFHGPAPDGNARLLLEAIRPGGFILSQRNIESFEQLHGLTASLAGGFGIPAFVGISQEGGSADRLKQLFAPLPPVREVASDGMASLRMFARIIGSQLEASGFNICLSPVLDLDTPRSVFRERTMAANPGDVTTLGRAYLDELTERGILACVKHFPGLGSALMDPHFVLPKIDKAKKSLLLDDALPFLNLIDDVPMMMVGHAFYPGLSAANGDEKPIPASLSHRVVGGLLRRKFGFEGVIVTDDLTMGAVHSVGLTSDIFLQAFEAGNDMMMFSQCTPLVEHGFRTMLRAARQSDAMLARVNASVERILKLKRRISTVPVRNRGQMRVRILRQIEKLARVQRTSAIAK